MGLPDPLALLRLRVLPRSKFWEPVNSPPGMDKFTGSAPVSKKPRFKTIYTFTAILALFGFYGMDAPVLGLEAGRRQQTSGVHDI